MNDFPLPRLKRAIPKLLTFLIAIYIYLILVPIKFFFSIFGLGPKLLEMIGKMQMGSGGATKVFEGYQPNANDIFVSTFAKSGTNWMMQIAHQASFHGQGDFEHIHDVVAWPDLDKKMRDRFCIPLTDKLVKQASPENFRVIKTHLSAHNVPYDEKAHYLIVLRDPKEVFVSSYYFGGDSYGPIMTDIDNWFGLFLSEKFPMNFGNTWAEHTASYWALKDQPNVLIMNYSEMKKDLNGSVQKVADSLGIELTKPELNEVIKRSSFAYMSNIDHKFQLFPKGAMPWKGDFKMIRQGKTGNSQELISIEQQMRIDEHFQNELKNLGSDFPYTDFFQLAKKG